MQKETRQNITWIVRGFQDTDKSSSYANSILQCLLRLNIVRQRLLNCDKLNVLDSLTHRYEKERPKLSTYGVRQSLGEYFSICAERDALQFLTTFCMKYDCIKNLVEHQVTSTSQCKACGNIQNTINNNVIRSIPIDNLEKRSHNLQDLINITSSHWHQVINKSCEHCVEDNILVKRELTLTRETMIIHFTLCVTG